MAVYTSGMLRAWFDRLPGWVIITAAAGLFAGFLWLGTLADGAAAAPIVLLGPVSLVAGIIAVAIRSTHREAAAVLADPELRFAWSVTADGPRLVWRRKAVGDPARFRRIVRLEVFAYAFLSVLLGAGYALVGWQITRTGGLRRDDLPTFIPVALVALGIYAVILRLALHALRNLAAFEIVADRQHRELRCTGVRPIGGLATVTFPMTDITRIAQRRMTYRYVTTVTVTLHLADGRTHLLFRLPPDDWDRIGRDLLPLVGDARA